MIGASPLRKEDQRLLRGGGRFVDDLTRDGVLHLGVVRSAESSARLIKVVTAGARALPGVVLAWSAADLGEIAPNMPTAYGGTQKGRAWAQPVLARDIVRHVGEPVAVVVAESAYQLADALDAVTVEYERLPSLPTAEAALASSARVHEGWPDNTAVVARGAVGDPERAMAGAHLVIRERMRHPRLSAVPIETRGVFAYRDRSSGALVVSSSTQSPYTLRDVVAAALGLPVEEVRVVVPDVGGGFGPKGPIYPEEILVAAAAHRLGRPVKWVESRRENLACMGHDREQNHDVRIGFARDGTIVAIDGSFVADVGAYPLQGDGLTANTVNHMPGPYRVPHYRNTGTSVVTTKTLNAAYRAAGRPEAVFVMERLMDIGARRLGLDPAEIRRRNFVRPAEMPYRPGLTYKDGVAVTYDPGDFPAAFEKALALLPYDEWRRRGPRGRRERRGRDSRVRARGRAHRAEQGPRRRHAPSGRELGSRRSRRGEVEGAQGDRRARPARVHLLLSRHRHVGVRHARRCGRGRRGDVRDPPARVRDRSRPGSRDQSDDRRGPAAGRRRPGHRRRADGRSRVRRKRSAPHRQSDGLRDPEGRPASPARGRARRASVDHHRAG